MITKVGYRVICFRRAIVRVRVVGRMVVRFVCVIRVPKCPVCPEDAQGATIAKDVCGVCPAGCALPPAPAAPAVLLF